MSRRHSRRAPRRPLDDEDDEGRPSGGFATVEVDADGEEWVVRHITGSSSTKTYRCPGCDQEIRPATPHVVAWRVDALDDRRHWHTPCWRARGRRAPTR